jgi:hypothetical protein
MFEYKLLTAPNRMHLEESITQLGDDGWRVQAVYPPDGLFGFAAKWSATVERERVRLRWQVSSAPDLAGYKVYWKIDDELPYTALVALPASVATYVLPPTFLRPGLAYEFAVAAYDVAGNESSKTVIARVTG